MNFASHLRQELASRALQYAHSQTLHHCLSYGEAQMVCFAPDENKSSHGNFIQESYQAITSNPAWRRRLTKVHSQGRTSLPKSDHGRWMELDSCASSDALLMNIFCYPLISRRHHFSNLLGVEPSTAPRFGYPARVPLVNGGFDRTEADMQLGNLLLEAKLTEGDFQRAPKQVLETYRDFHDVFDHERLPQTEHHYVSYQLLRYVLAAHALQCSFCVLLDARRPDLSESWYAVMKCVNPLELRTALRVLTWQELAETLPSKLRAFLAVKYGIESGTRSQK